MASNRRGQTGVVTALLLGGIVLVGIISAYSWGMPILQKNQDRSTLETALDKMEQLQQTISTVAKRGGSERISFPLSDGSLTIDVDNDTIRYAMTTGVAYVSTGNFTPLNENEMRGLYEANRGDEYGVLGRDKDGVIAGRATPQGEDFRTEYRLVFRELYDLQAKQGFKVNLKENGNLQGAGGTVDIVFEKEGEETVQGESNAGGPLNKRNILIRVE